MNIILDIIFHFGESINEGGKGSFSAYFSAFLGTITAIAIFYLRIIYERVTKAKEEERNNHRKLHYFSAMLESIVKITKSQSTEMESFYTEQLKDDVSIRKLTILPTNDLRRIIESANHEEYYQYYLKKFEYKRATVEEFRKIYTIIDYLNSQMAQLDEIIRNSFKFDWERRDEYRMITSAAIENAGLMATKYPIGTEEGRYAQFLFDTYNKFLSTRKDTSDLNEMQTGFIEPLLGGIIKDYSKLHEALVFGSSLKKAMDIFEDIKQSNRFVAEEIREINGEYDRALIELEKISDKLKVMFIDVPES